MRHSAGVDTVARRTHEWNDNRNATKTAQLFAVSADGLI